MRFKGRHPHLSIMIMLFALIAGCEKPGKVELTVVDPEFYVKRVSEWGFEVAAKGKIRNVGEVDVKNVVVTGNCPVCPESHSWDNWFRNIEKADGEKSTIPHLSRGAQEDFNFVGVAMFTSRTGKTPAALPEKLEVNIVSFEPDK